MYTYLYPKQVRPFHAPIFPNIAGTAQHCVQITCTKLHQNRKRKCLKTARNPFTHLSRVWLSVRWISLNSRLRGKFSRIFFCNEFYLNWQEKCRKQGYLIYTFHSTDFQETQFFFLTELLENLMNSSFVHVGHEMWRVRARLSYDLGLSSYVVHCSGFLETNICVMAFLV